MAIAIPVYDPTAVHLFIRRSLENYGKTWLASEYVSLFPIYFVSKVLFDRFLSPATILPVYYLPVLN